MIQRINYGQDPEEMHWSVTCIISHESQRLYGLSDLYMNFHFLSPFFKIQLVTGEGFSKNKFSG